MVPLLWMTMSRFGVVSSFSSGSRVSNGLPLHFSKGIGQASYLLVWYGLVSGILLYVGWFLLYLAFGTTSVFELSLLLSTFDNSISLKVGLGSTLVFLSGCIKLSLAPFHVWLGKVHVEASTIGSVLLAGISLKTGFYLHILIWPSLYLVSGNFLCDLLCFFFLVGGFVSSVSLFYQVDVKRCVALYSVSHMNLFYLLLFGCIRDGISLGTILDLVMMYGMIGHSFIASGLFFLVGSLADRYGTRSLVELSGLISYSSVEWFLLLVLLCGNSGYPLIVLFIYEVLGYTCLVDSDLTLAFICALLSCLCLLSSLLLFSRLSLVGSSSTVVPSLHGTGHSLILVIGTPLAFLSILLGLHCTYPIANLC
jgi:NADH-quinone oxidoreductase subunit M